VKCGDTARQKDASRIFVTSRCKREKCRSPIEESAVISSLILVTCYRTILLSGASSRTRIPEISDLNPGGSEYPNSSFCGLQKIHPAKRCRRIP
jgi:hypothetical protein